MAVSGVALGCLAINDLTGECVNAVGVERHWGKRLWRLIAGEIAVLGTLIEGVVMLSQQFGHQFPPVAAVGELFPMV